MAVPEEIRKVKRPVNTIVEDNRNSGSGEYSVRERVCVEYVKGGNPRPKNGKVVGHITNGVYVPIVDGVQKDETDMYCIGYRNKKTSAIIAISLTLVIYLLFTVLLHIRIPLGFWVKIF